MMYKGLLVICLVASSIAVDSSTQTECKGWIDCGREKLKTLINIPTSVAKGSMNIIKDTAKAGMEIANTAADYSTGVAHQILDGSLILTNKSIDASTKLVHESTKMANDIMDKNNIPLKGYVKKITQVVDKGTDIMSGVSNFGIATTHQVGSAVIQTANGAMHAGNSMANGVVQKATNKVENIVDFSAGAASKSVDIAADIMNSIL